MKIGINIKTLGKRQKAVAPVVYEIPDEVQTLQDVITALVKIEVGRYNAKGFDNQQMMFLSADDIENQSQVGKVSFRTIYSEKKADLNAATENAIQCFNDGMVRILKNDIELTQLEDKIDLQEGDVLTFIRLTFLAGRMW